MQAGWIVAGVVFAAGGIGLAVAARTRWLQSDTLKKCLLLSVVAHVALAIVAASIGGLSPASWGRSDEGRMTMVVVVSEEPEGSTAAVSDLDDLAGPGDAVGEDVPPGEAPATEGEVMEAGRDDLVAVSPEADLATEAIGGPEPGHQEADESGIVPLLEVVSDETRKPAGVPAKPAASSPYEHRGADRRPAAAVALGGSEDTERAVARGLAWLARAQSSDGRWDAARHGAGVERSVQGHDRKGAGARSDHGVTGLAVLAFLGAGSTHREGGHAAEVARAIEFLIGRQKPDGSLAGDAEFFAALYCHGMATIALGEACGMTGDERLREPLARAVAHTLSRQSPATGGWRYAAGDRGDTSQLGWQVMALTAARNAGLMGLEASLARAGGFLAGVSSGRAGGLAAYRAGERPTAAMTAEALFCRLLLGIDPAHPSVSEAVSFLEAMPPDSGPFNAYACYYGTLAMFHAGGPAWERWNERMQRAILPGQRSGGDLDGSWDPDAVWGGHGGRVYSTALSVLCLEVYYRYLPMHQGRVRRVASVVPPP
jgi:hypothetical protein